MAQQTINVGTAPNDGTGTPLRTAFQYTNSNFSELYTAVGPSGNNIVVPGNATITGDLTVDTSTLKVDSANNRVGIGTATPDSLLQMAGAGTINWKLSNTADSVTVGGYAGTTTGTTGTVSNHPFFLFTNNTERYRLASDGVATWSNVGGVAGAAMTLNSTGLGVGGSPSYKLSSIGTTNNQVVLHVGNTAGTVDGDTTNVVRFAAGSGANALWANARYDGFSHAWRCNSTTTQAMTLDASGRLQVGTTTPISAGERMGVQINTSGSWSITMGSVDRGWLNRQSSATGGIAAYFEVGSSNTNVGSITTTASATSYTSASDYRLKEAVQPLVGGLARVSALKPSIYKWKVDGSNGEGFLAHELAEVVPLAVTGEKDAVNDDGSIKAQGVDLSKVVPVLVAAIQELAAEVNALKNA